MWGNGAALMMCAICFINTKYIMMFHALLTTTVHSWMLYDGTRPWM